ncbi:hypothetical protein LXA43DRAFT_1081428 [Ganoderma leucocontextum]|nr:hypothetical protein LXA43DRAFT_1081428 [Ganoderma leucocontextum]
MAAIVISAFALALFCFLVLSIICIGTLVVFIYRRYPQLRSSAVDVEAQTHSSPSASSATNTQDSATLSCSSEPHGLAAVPSRKSSGNYATSSDDMPDRLSKSAVKSPQDAKSTWKRRPFSWVLRDDKYTRFPSLRASLARTKAKAMEKWTPSNSETSLTTIDVTCISEDVPSVLPKEFPSSKESTSGTLALASCVEKLASAPKDSSPTPEDDVSATRENGSRSSTSEESTSTSREPSSTSASIESTSAFLEPDSASAASTPTLVSNVSTPATTWEPQTPPSSTTVPTNIADRSECRPSPSMESLEDRLTELNVAALAQSEVILASGSLPTCLSGLSDVIGCLNVRGSLIEDLAKAAVHPTHGLGFDVSWLSQAVISISLGSELCANRATSPMPRKVVDARPQRPTISTPHTVAVDKENMDNGSLSSDSKTACEATAPEKTTEGERYAALADALSTTFSLSSLQGRGSTRHSVVSASASSSDPSVAHVSDLSLGLDVSYELSYDASESDFDGSFCCSDDEDCQLRPHYAADPSLHQRCSRNEHVVLAI